MTRAAVFLAVALATLPAHAGLDLSRAVTFSLDNGLTLVVLEEHTLPVVSVQMLYTVGARNEPVGQTGIAHFLEHMAFRATESFPDTEVVSAIYAVGGEWHGYTWLDQTTYFETLPAEHLDLALRIEADRMLRLEIPAAEVEAERGAVLAEMHGYENDPATLLKDALLTVSFLHHPYRNNTIGWESDVRSISHEQLVAFYRRHYRPANAVLAVVGDVSAAQVRARVEELFGRAPRDPASLPPPTVEPPQTGLRRVELAGPGGRSRFEIAYRAPPVSHPDYPGFLVLQKILGGGSGVNFLQNEWGDPVGSDARLGGIVDDLATWFIPTEFPYVLTLAGSVDDGASREEVEARLEEAVARFRSEPPGVEELEAARRAVLDDLLFDIETTEDAAHQLASFTGLGAAETLVRLPALLAALTPDGVQAVARRYLQPEQRTIGWYLAGRPAAAPLDIETASEPGLAIAAPARPAVVAGPEPAGPPRLVPLPSGLPLLVQRLPLTSAAHLRLLVPTTAVGLDGDARPDEPVWRHTAIDFRFRPEELVATVARARRLLDTAAPRALPPVAEIADPASRLGRELDEILAVAPLPAATGPVAISLVGDVDEAAAIAALRATFGDLAPPEVTAAGLRLAATERSVRLPAPPAQAQLGYVVPAPPAGSPEALAWRMLLYVLSHGYEGRLGKEAISRQGLVYYIDARYDSDGANGRVSLTIGVDPAKLGAMRELLIGMLDDLRDNPPSEAELAEAKRHLVGRRASAAQSNAEVSSKLLRDWSAWGRPLADDEFSKLVDAVTLEDLAAVVPAFVAGAVVVVDG